MKVSCVLLVEDTEMDRYVARRVLSKCWPGVSILEARDGVEAIELLGSLACPVPDLILLDVNMPRMGGHEFLEAYYQQSGHASPVVMMLTSSNRDDDRERAERFGCVKYYLTKPLTRAALVAMPGLLDEVA